MHINPILRSFRWLKITEHIEYGAYLSLTASACKVLSTNQSSYLHNLITVRPPRNTHSSSHSITFDRPSTSSSQRITDSYFQYAPRSSLESSRLLSVNNARGPIYPILIHPVLRVVLGGSPIGSIDSPLSSPITPPLSLFHSRLKTFLFCISFLPYSLLLLLRSGMVIGRTELATLS